jgi:hypothetical protein
MAKEENEASSPEIFEAIPRNFKRIRPRGPWAKLSAQMTEVVEVHAGRWDLVVSIAPKMGQGSPACMIHPRAAIEIDGTHLAVPPNKVGDLSTPTGRRAAGPAYGLLCHEASHAAHTKWTHKIDENTIKDGRVLEAAIQLEESRIEAKLLRDRPQDWEWLHNSAKALAADHLRHHEKRGSYEWAVGVCALVLARADAGSLTWKEVSDLKDEADAQLGGAVVNKLRRIWKQALGVRDTDHRTMLDLGRQWVELTARPGDDSKSAIGMLGGYGGPPGRKKKDGSGQGKPETTPGPIEDPGLGRQEEAELKEAARRAARSMAGVGPGMDYYGAGVAGWRKPTIEEKAAARKLAQALERAIFRERVVTVQNSAVPPGKLRMRAAMAGRAARAAGVVTLPEPFRHEKRHVTPAPPLRIGVCEDVSGSMTAEALAIGQAGWMISYAASMVPQAESALVVYSNRKVKPVIFPGRRPDMVPEIRTGGGDECIGDAIETLDGQLGLSRKGAARLLVIVSDSRITQEGQAPKAAKLIQRLLATGCHVLWVTNLSLEFYKVHNAGHRTGGHEVPYPISIPGVRSVSAKGPGIIPIITTEVVATLEEAK